MGTSLTGLTPSTTYDALIKVGDNGPLSATAKYLSDGLGNDSALALSTGNIGIGTTSPSRNLHILGGSGVGTVLKLEAGSGAIAYLQLAYNGATNAQSGYIGYDSSSNMGLFTNDTERMRITSAGNVGIGTSSPSAGYKFDVRGRTIAYNLGYIADFVSTESNASSIQMYADNTNVSIVQGGTAAVPLTFFIGGTEKVRFQTGGGISFNGDTAAANALDDYEEGTWTPTYRQDGTANTATYATRSGTYTKIGNLVTAFFDIDASSLTAGSGNCQVAGLPFTVSNSMAGFSFVSFRDPSVFVGTAVNVTFIGFAQKGDTYIMCRNISTTTGAESAQSSFASSGRVTGVVQYIA